jgi:hypothetical protein
VAVDEVDLARAGLDEERRGLERALAAADDRDPTTAECLEVDELAAVAVAVRR